MSQINIEPILETDFQFPKQKKFYKGKVRDLYTLEDDILIMIVSDRISAFDVVMPKGIPYKGQVLNQIANKFMDATEDIVPNWKIASPDPNVTIGKLCKPFKIEMVIRGFLTGHAAREYESGKRVLCGNKLPQNIKENEKFKRPIITPTTKEKMGGHDEDISKQEILEKNIISEKDYEKIEAYTYKLFERGSEIAIKKGLILVDTKYEFGKTADGKIVLIDEIHTPDSSRYFYADSYEENLNKGIAQRQLSKEFMRQWLIKQGFQGKMWHKIPNMDDAFIKSISERYIELYQTLLGESFVPEHEDNAIMRIENNIIKYLSKT